MAGFVSLYPQSFDMAQKSFQVPLQSFAVNKNMRLDPILFCNSVRKKMNINTYCLIDLL